ncbi:MAG: hypothetical protein HQK98_10520 [Nitrospirae bacterium]|nr:hypothetical protein [Nitrospirota bacterium]
MPGYIVVTVMFLFVLVPSVWADDDGGYDVNTEVTLTGVVTEADEAMMGPYVFTMVAEDKTYKVLTGPWWYLKQIGLAVRVGMKVEVTGSKFYNKKGVLSIAAYSITDIEESKTYRFRDGNSQMPLWHGHGNGRQRQS